MQRPPIHELARRGRIRLPPWGGWYCQRRHRGAWRVGNGTLQLVCALAHAELKRAEGAAATPALTVVGTSVERLLPDNLGAYLTI